MLQSKGFCSNGKGVAMWSLHFWWTWKLGTTPKRHDSLCGEQQSMSVYVETCIYCTYICMHIFGDKALYFAFTVCAKILAKVIGRIPLLSSHFFKASVHWRSSSIWAVGGWHWRATSQVRAFFASWTLLLRERRAGCGKVKTGSEGWVIRRMMKKRMV